MTPPKAHHRHRRSRGRRQDDSGQEPRDEARAGLSRHRGHLPRPCPSKALREGVSLDDEAALVSLAERCDIAFGGERFEKILLDGEDVSRAIRDPPVALASSRVAIHPRVRALLVQLWRKIGASGGVILEGRDIGTEVFPDADIKFFLDAGQGERASRRFREQGEGAARHPRRGETRAPGPRRDRSQPDSFPAEAGRATRSWSIPRISLPRRRLRSSWKRRGGRLEEADLT